MFGPCETCNDALSGYKAACEARVSVRDANRRGSDERKTQPLIAKVLALRLAGDVEGARTLLAQGAAPAFVSWLASVNRLIDLEERLNNESAAQARALTGSFLAWMAVLCAIAVGAGSLGAWFIGRGLMRQLGGQPGYAADIVRSIAAGDLGVRIATAPGDQSSLLFAKASTEIAAGNQDLSNRTENQADTLKDTAASMEELTGTVRQNADNARQANQNATLVEQASAAAASLQDEAATLADVVSVFKMEQQAARGVASTPQRLALSLSV